MQATEPRQRLAPRRERPVSTLRGTGRGLSIGILAHVGMQNLGDEIMYAATVSYYRRRLPEARLVGFSMNPADTRTRYGIEVHPIRPPGTSGPTSIGGGRFEAYARTLGATIPTVIRELRFAITSARRLRGLDMIIVPGSSQFIDGYGGPWGFPLALLRWTLFARAARVPICFLSLGAEKLEHPLSRWMVRRTVHLASFITLRDEVSRDRLAAQGVRRDISLAPDLSLGYPVGLPGSGTNHGKTGTVGINPIPYYHGVFWREVDEKRYRRYLDSMIGLTADVLRRGHRVIIYGTTQWADRVPALDIVDGLRGLFGPDVLERVATPEVNTLEDLMTVLSAVDWVVASRYHGVATALLMRKPVVGIAYERKTTDLMANLGLGDYSIPIEEIDGSSLAALLDGVQRNDGAIREALDVRAREGRTAVNAQYRQVLEKYTKARGDVTWA